MKPKLANVQQQMSVSVLANYDVSLKLKVASGNIRVLRVIRSFHMEFVFGWSISSRNIRYFNQDYT